jgi:P-type Cu+ transporter
MPTGETIELKPHRTAQTRASAATELAITGMTCGNCARHVTEAIQSVAGVRSATVRLDAQAASVRWAADAEPALPAVLRAVEEAGYGARVTEPRAKESSRRTLAGWELNLWLGLVGTAPLMAGEWLFGLGAAGWFRWCSFVLAAAVQVFAGARFYRGAWGQLKAGRSNMDTLVALGSTTAFAYSTWALLSGLGGHVYFMEAAAIITLISVGHWLESRVSDRASSALRQLLKLAPDLARRRDPGGSEAEVPVAELQAGDVVVLRPGDRVPTDGAVVEGDSALDESMLTGESVPVDKSAGSQLYAGTVNVNGRLVMRVTATGEGTALAHIIAAVQRAQTSRANIQRLGDRVSNVFVPLVVAAALAAGLWWGLAPASAGAAHDWLAQFLWPAHPPQGGLAAACIIAAAVLIIACPCAMGLATPAAIMAGSNAAAQRGILVRDGVALEKAGQVTAVVFDKTGTLTAGKAEVVDVWDEGQIRSPKAEDRRKSEGPKSEGHDAAASEVSALAASLARHSTHPVSQAVARLSEDEIELADWEEVRGAGVQGKLRGTREEEPRVAIQSPITHHPTPVTQLGSLRWLRESGVDLGPGHAFIERQAAQGATLVGLAQDKSLRGLFAVKDAVKAGARDVVEQLQRQGLAIYLITGDNALTAASIAAQVGIPRDNVFAEIRPEQKAEFVQKLQRQGKRVAFVGDGINDAPALEQADLGVAVSRASDVAREAADIILLKSEIEAVPEALGLARATLRTIKQNLFWAFFYNALGVPLAALGFMSPILCAAAMGVSDLVVIGNALRLRGWRLRKI